MHVMLSSDAYDHRVFGLYSSRTKGRWSHMPYVAARAPEGWRASHLNEASAQEAAGFEPLDDGEGVTVNARKRAWARLLAKVYEIDPMVCPKCGGEMKVIAVIQDPMEIRDILGVYPRSSTKLSFGPMK
jgi:hypothetical protein